MRDYLKIRKVCYDLDIRFNVIRCSNLYHEVISFKHGNRKISLDIRNPNDFGYEHIYELWMLFVFMPKAFSNLSLSLGGMRVDTYGVPPIKDYDGDQILDVSIGHLDNRMCVILSDVPEKTPSHPLGTMRFADLCYDFLWSVK